MYKTVLFDLDGTITDPKEGITRSVRYALRKFSIDIENLDELEKFIGPPLKQSFMDFFSFSGEQSLRAIEYYREYFREKGIFENRVYEGIPEILSELKAGNVTLAIATSKPTVFAEQIIAHFQLSGYFEEIIGSNLDNSRSEKKDVIAHALSELKCEVSQTVMIGDRKHDIIGAKENRMDSVGVLYGYGSREEIRAAGPVFIAESVGELAPFLLN